MWIGAPNRCSPDSRTKYPHELIWESNFAYTSNVDSFLDLRIHDQKLYHLIIVSLYRGQMGLIPSYHWGKPIK
jgi:hypothetical protein